MITALIIVFNYKFEALYKKLEKQNLKHERLPKRLENDQLQISESRQLSAGIGLRSILSQQDESIRLRSIDIKKLSSNLEEFYKRIPNPATSDNDLLSRLDPIHESQIASTVEVATQTIEHLSTAFF
jgi:hypothetical protein